MPAILAEGGTSSEKNKITLHLLGALDLVRIYLNAYFFDWQASKVLF